VPRASINCDPERKSGGKGERTEKVRERERERKREREGRREEQKGRNRAK